MTDLRAYALREPYELETFGGSVALPDGSTFRVDDALVDGDGLIVTGDPAKITILDSYEATVDAGLPDMRKRLDGYTIAELRAFADENFVELGNAERKSDILDVIAGDVEPDTSEPPVVADEQITHDPNAPANNEGDAS